MANLANELADINPHEENVHPSQVPPSASLSTQIYEANVPELKHLQDDLLKEILEFYTKLIKSKRTVDLLNKNGKDGEVDPSDVESLCEDLEELSDKREKLQEKL